MAPKHFIREWRKFRGMTMEQVASQIGTGHAVLSRVERGEQRYNQELLEALAEVLNCSVADLIVRNPAAPDDLTAALARLGSTEKNVVLRIVEALAETGRSDSAEAEAALVGMMMYEPGVALLLSRSVFSTESVGDDLLGPIAEVILTHVEQQGFKGIPDPVTVDKWITDTWDRELDSCVLEQYEVAGALRYLVELAAQSPPSTRLADLAGEVAAAEVRRSLRVLHGH